MVTKLAIKLPTKPLLSAAIVVCSTWLGAVWLTGAARAEDCPVTGIEAVEKAILAAPTCGRSVRVLKACAFGATSDVALAQKAIDKCEARFSRRISKQRNRAYRASIARCDARYGRLQGSMYLSLAALCRAEAAATTARVSRRR